MRVPVVAALAVSAAITFSAQSFKPGVERWPIKTRMPSGPAKTFTFEEFTAIPTPEGVTKNDKRFQAHLISSKVGTAGVQEGDLVTVTGWLHLVAGESDGDYHIQISNSQASGDDCVVVEVPRPEETFVASAPLREAAATVRAFIRSNLLHDPNQEPGEAGRVMVHPPFVRVTGALFFDDAHVGDRPRGKRQMKATTLWELHPVTVLAFAPVPR